MKCVRTPLLLVFSVLLCLSAKATLSAQNGVLSHFGLNAKANAFGNAMSSVAEFGPIGFYNPALSAFAGEQIQFDVAASSMSFDRQLSTLGAGVQLPPNAGIYTYLMGFRVNNIQERTTSGYYLGDFNANELRFGTAFGIRFSEKLAVGVGLKINRAQLHPEIVATPSIGLDIGFLYRLNQKINISITATDLLSTYSWDTADYFGEQQSAKQTDTQPIRLIFGTSFRNKSWLAAIDFENRRYNGVYSSTDIVELGGIPTTFSEEIEESYWISAMRLGLARVVNDRLQVQTGYAIPSFEEASQQQWSFGFTLNLPFDTLSPQIQYTLIRENLLGELQHQLGLQLTF